MNEMVRQDTSWGKLVVILGGGASSGPGASTRQTPTIKLGLGSKGQRVLKCAMCPAYILFSLLIVPMVREKVGFNQRRATEAQNGYGSCMLPGYVSREFLITSCTLLGSSICRLFRGIVLESSKFQELCRIPCDVNPIFHTRSPTALNCIIFGVCSCSEETSSHKNWSEQTQCLARCAFWVVSL